MVWGKDFELEGCRGKLKYKFYFLYVADTKTPLLYLPIFTDIYCYIMNTIYNHSVSKSNYGSPYLLANATYKGYVAFVIIESTGKIFCEVSGSFYADDTRYYDLDDFAGTNIVRRCCSENFDDSADSMWEIRRHIIGLAEGCPDATGHITHYALNDMVMRELCTFLSAKVTARSRNEIAVFGEITDRIITNFYQVKATGECIYMIDNVIYSQHFPIEWALTPKKVYVAIDGVDVMYICGPGTSAIHCMNCAHYGSLHGVFIGYCTNCAIDYELTRGYGFEYYGVESSSERVMYLRGVNLDTVGYNMEPTEKYNCCLSGGVIPFGPDICDDQEDVDPVYEDEVDEYVQDVTDPTKIGRTWASKRHPRRAYGLPFGVCNEVFTTDQTDEFTPDVIRCKMETFLRENDIEITDDNYSFPIGQRPEWDCYRVTKRPGWWYAWDAVLRDPRNQYPEVNLHIRLYVSNVHSAETPAKLQLECNNVRGRNPVFWPMRHAMKSWLLSETDTPLIVMPSNLYRDEYIEYEGELYPAPVPIY